MLKERKFYRHPSDIPIEIWRSDESELHLLKNISLGGLAFESKTEWKPGEIVGIRVLVQPTFELVGKVVWCRKSNHYYDVGVEFVENNPDDKEVMVEEVCEVEWYKDILAKIPLTDEVAKW